MIGYLIILYKNTVHIEKLHSRNEACENLVLDKLRDVDVSGVHVCAEKNQARSQISGIKPKDLRRKFLQPHSQIIKTKGLK
jgi:hypothetical protein